MTKPVFYIIGLLILSFGLAVILASIHSQQSSVHAQSVASVSIVKGSSSPSIAKPYDPSPVTIKPGTRCCVETMILLYIQ